MRLNRELQHRILLHLQTSYPEETMVCEDDPDTCANITYLIEHGLIHSSYASPESSLVLAHELPLKITARGLDFLEQDGGLSAILGTVTVKLHADTIKNMLESRILSAELPAEDKKRFVDTLRELPGETLKTFTNKLVEMACDNPQAVVTALSRFVP